MGGGHCVKVWAKKQQVVSLSPRASCTPQFKLHLKVLGSRAWQRTWRYRVG